MPTTTNNSEKTKTTRTTKTRTSKATTKKFQPDDLIPCRCVKGNTVIYVSTKTGQRYEWNGFGDVNEVMYSDLASMKASRSSYLYDPKFIIEDEDLVKQWSSILEPIYAAYVGKQNPLDFFKMDAEDLRKALTDAPLGLKDLLAAEASKLVRAGQFDSIAKLKVIDEVLGTQLQLFI